MNINFNINFDRIVRFSQRFWIKVGSELVKRIRADAGQGKFQTDEPHKATYSPGYARLKERRFKHATKRRYAVNQGGMEYGQKEVFRKKNGRKGERYSAYKGVSIVSTNTSFVDMTVTGQTLRGLHVKESSNKNVLLSYQTKDAAKIIGNQERGLNRRLVGLNRKNQKVVEEMIISAIQEAVVKEIVGKTTININM